MNELANDLLNGLILIGFVAVAIAIGWSWDSGALMSMFKRKPKANKRVCGECRIPFGHRFKGERVSRCVVCVSHKSRPCWEPTR